MRNNQNIFELIEDVVDKNKVVNEINSEFLSELKKKTFQFGEFNFEDDVWYCSKYHLDSKVNGAYTIHFNKTPAKYKDITKYFALVYKGAISTKSEKVYYLNSFYKFLKDEYTHLSISEVDMIIFGRFIDYIHLLDLSKRSKEKTFHAAKKFFETMYNFEGIPYLNLNKTKNPFAIKKSKTLKGRIIPKEDLKKLDEFIFQNEDLPLVLKTYYWILRIYPNRHSEVSSIRIDCLTPMQGHFLLRIPSTKTNGGYPIPEIKAIPMAFTGHSKYVINLIKQQQVQVRALLDSTPLSKYYKHCDDFLLLDRMFKMSIKNGEIIVEYEFNYSGSANNVRQLYPLTDRLVNKHLAVICKYLNISADSPITTHRFRHNAISDRRNMGYTREQTMQLTDHKTNTMHDVYYHQDSKRHLEIFKEIEDNLFEINKVPTLFQGKILNIENKGIEKALLNKGVEQHLINRLKKPGSRTIGICGEITSSECNPKGTAYKYECYACNWFIPSADNINEYQEDYEYWLDVRDRTQNDQNRIAIFENAVRNMALLNRVISICKNSIKAHK